MIAFIKKIRASNQQTKLKWLIIFSSISMVIVIAIWVMALRVITTDIENPSPVATETMTLGARFKNVLRELGFRTSTAISNIKGSIKSKEIELTPVASTTQQ